MRSHREKNIDRYRQRSRERVTRKNRENLAVINSLKDGKFCTDCGELFPPFCMDFDHVKGTKHKAIGQLLRGGNSTNLVLKETKLCELVCVNCHRIRTVARRPPRKIYNKSIEKKAKLVSRLKSRPCSQCGKKFHSSAMEFDHIDPSTKEFSISNSVFRGIPFSKMKDEIRKCRIVCSVCHRKITFG